MEPSEIHPIVEAAFNAKDIEALIALYEPDAWFFSLDGPVQGVEAIRSAWAGIMAMEPGPISMTTLYAIEHGDIAMISNRWSMSVGGEEMSAATAEVVRRQADGTWKYVIDNPDAAGVLGELTP
jgi:ketosteroid isomerase-like protein